MRLHIFTEGIDDTKFFKNFIEACLKQYSKFQYFEYSEMPDIEVENAIRTANEQNIDYIFVADFDFRDKNLKNIEDKISEIKFKWSILDEKNIFIVLNEIESWYLAGYSDKFCSGKTHLNKEIMIKTCIDTQVITKEFFKHASTKSHRNLINYLIRKKSNFDFTEARNRNKSFQRFHDKYCNTK